MNCRSVLLQSRLSLGPPECKPQPGAKHFAKPDFGPLTPPQTQVSTSSTGRCGGMVDAGDSKSPDGNIVRVRVSPPAPVHP